MPTNQSNISRKTPNAKTNTKSCPLSSEKLRRKINGESIQIRKQKRENLFNKKRNNLAYNSNDEQSKSLISSFSSTIRSQDLIECTKRLEIFYMNVQTKQTLLNKSPGQSSPDFFKLLCEDNLAILSECARRYRCLTYENKLIKQMNDSESDCEDVENSNPVQSRYDVLVEQTVNSISALVDTMIDNCFKIYDLRSQLAFTEFFFYLQRESLITDDREERYALNFIQFCSDHPLEIIKIPLYVNFFHTISSLVDLTMIDDTNQLGIYVTSEHFLNLLNQHAKFVVYILKQEVEREIQMMNNQSTDNPIEHKSSLDSHLIDQYLEHLFNFAHSLSTFVVLDTNDDQDTLYQLICNLKELIKLHTSDRLLVLYLHLINNFFEPYLDYALLDFLVPSVNVQEFCGLLIKTDCAKYGDCKREHVSNDTVSLVDALIHLISNITSLKFYCEQLIDCKVLPCIQNLFLAVQNDQMLVRSILTMIRNFISEENYTTNADPTIATTSKFPTITRNSYDQMFSVKFVDHFINSIDSMDGRCQSQAVAILEDVFKNAKHTIVRSFLNMQFIRTLHNLLRLNDRNITFSVLNILLNLLQKKDLDTNQLIHLMDCSEKSGLLDVIESLSFNPTEKISRSADYLLDCYENLSELRESLTT